MTFQRLRRAAFIVLGCCLVGAIGFWFWAGNSYKSAQDLAKHGLWNRAAEAVRPYLWIHPWDEQALLLMAESLVKDESKDGEKSVNAALAFLARIPDSSSHAPDARLQEAKVSFLILHRPASAERSLMRAMELAPDNVEAELMLMHLYEMTGRYYQTESLFWRAYELSPPADKALRLREWYMSQFFPLSKNEVLDRNMGFLAPQEEPGRESESRRYISFRENERNEVLGHAALAAWLQREGQPTLALEALDKTPQYVVHAYEHPFFVATLIATLVDLGELKRASEVLAKWPGPKDTHDFWKWNAILAEEADSNLPLALESYTNALALWPGPTDWRLRYRKVNCLVQMGRAAEAAAERKTAEAIEKLMEDEVHSQLRHALGSLNDPHQLTAVVDFYRRLSRDREVKCWVEHLNRLGDTVKAPDPK